MGEGQDKVARSLLDLEPSAILDLFLVYPDYTNNKDIVYGIHNGSIFKKGVVWQGRTYMPIGMEIDGIEINADGRINRPKIKISNKDYFVTSLLRKFDDFQSARIVQKRTFVKYLDDENFDGGNPFGESDSRAEISSQEYIVAQKSQENKIFVEFELTSPFDLDNFELNHRRIMGKYCYWQYRGEGCGYTGPPIHRENGKDFEDVNGVKVNLNLVDFNYKDSAQEYSDTKDYIAGDVVFLSDENPANLTSSEYIENTSANYYVAKTDVQGLRPDLNSKYWDKDGCNKKFSSCKLHFPKDAFIDRFVGTDTTEINSASYNTNGTISKSAALGERIRSPDSVNQIVVSEGYNIIKNQDQWTLAFNLKELRNESFEHMLFDTAWGARTKSLFLNIREGVLGLSVYEDTGNPGTKRTISERRDFPLINHPIIVRQNNNKSISLIEPSIDSNNTLELSLPINKRDEIRNFFIGSYYIEQAITSTPMVIDSICLWRKALTDAEIENLYRKATDGGLRAKKYSQLEGTSLRDSVVSWWEGAYKNNPDIVPDESYSPNGFKGDGTYDGIEDKEAANDLILHNGWAEDTLTVNTNSYEYNITERIFIEGDAILPFGGFPGTDGFGFFRDT